MNHAPRGRFRRRLALLAGVSLAIVLGVQPLIASSAHAAPKQASGPTTITFRGQSYDFTAAGATPPTDAQCRAVGSHRPCYSPQEIRNAYGLAPVINAGYVGTGQTIVIIDSFGSPTIASDLATFDAGYGLPDPPSFTILAPLGTVPFDPNGPDMIGWAAETTLDVEWSHAMAPGANIVLMTSPVDETEGVQGLPEFLKLEQYALDHHLGKIISQSWAATENTLMNDAGKQVIHNFETFYERAAREHVTVFSSTGDSGSANVDVNGNNFPFPTVNYPASSKWVSAVGGTSLFADTSGAYQSETVWNNGPGSATGGGVSQIFEEPNFQKTTLNSGDQAILNHHRGIPDISWNANPRTSILIYLSFLTPGFYRIGGTSEGSPQLAGMIADANQWAGRPLGYLNPALYALGSGANYSADFHDVTVGDNSNQGIPGYSATPSWDAATGWGTPNATNLLAGLIAATARH
ncbi:MAG TPA: S53 family peptidase [Ktedonobacterales bacterium]|nr:S53 family peptidase [Ktedonobacterales bacterium]